MCMEGPSPYFHCFEQTQDEQQSFTAQVPPVVVSSQLAEGAGQVVEEEAEIDKEYGEDETCQRNKGHIVAAVTLPLFAA